MKNQHTFMGLALSACVFGMCAASTFAADETLRSLAEKNNIYIGAILNSQWFSGQLPSNYEQIHKTQFNIVVAENEMKFDATEPSEGRFSYGNGDKMVKYAKANGMRVRGHALAWHSQVPGWVNNYKNDKQKLLKVLKNHIENVVGHWKGQIDEWDVVNEAISNNEPQWRTGSVWYQGIGPEFIDSAFVWTHAVDPDAELCYNDYNLEQGINPKAKAGFLLEQVKRWVANGIPITCVGSQTHVEDTTTDKHFIGSPDSLRSLAKELAKLNIKLKITELDIGFKSGINVSKSDLERQGKTFREYLDIVLEEPNADTYLIWGVSDKWSWLSGLNRQKGLIYDDNLKPKPAFDSIMVRLQTFEPPQDTTKQDTTTTDTTAADTIKQDTSIALPQFAGVKALSMHVSGRTLFISGAKSAKVEVFDMQGRPVFSGKCEKGSFELKGVPEGIYMVRVREQSASLVQKIAIK
ncbi:MAG: endo-1,4-beta-xylanase [Fibrobacter sp.]|uniref:endo-1,4-beta-xylanase n=1 Tax=Fibrobacter sp. TaxID=35828 RepID=UPI0025BE85A5|nr:endo-1,4-beta-xylanase [Fibrobacter sp.]MBR4786170.1 endo-1,4-beta-xylanase [Fibrobacter sp.]